MTAIQKTDESGINALNSLIMNGDMSKLSQKEKLEYYHGICKSIGLNPLTNPFQYMRLNGKEVLYATKGAAEQIRNIKGISVTSQSIEWADDLVIVTVEGRDKEGRIDTETGFAAVGNLKGDGRGNALLKAITKAKRRLTLSMAGLGMLDETEVDSIPAAQKIDITSDGEVIENKGFPKIEFEQTPFQIKVTLRGDKPDWATWARTITSCLKIAPDQDVDEWLELNKDAYANVEVDRPDIFEKVSNFIDGRVQKMHDQELIKEMV